MKFGSREICDVVFRAKSQQKIGDKIFYAGQPVLVLDTAKTSTLEGDSETTYATGGRGNSNLIAWDGSKTITFTVEDALISPIGLSILMGADIADTTDGGKVHVHKMARFGVEKNGATAIAGYVNGATSETSTAIAADAKYIEISSYYKGATFTSGTETGTGTFSYTQSVCTDAPLWLLEVNADNSLTGDYVAKDNFDFVTTYTAGTGGAPDIIKNYIVFKGTVADNFSVGTTLHLDFYVIRDTADVTEIQVRKDKFAGYFYVEAETLYRRQDTGADLPAVITIPKVKIQSNFSFSMSADGDPSTFSFVMDAFPDKTYFDQTKEVLVVIQIVDDDDKADEEIKTVMPHKDDEVITYDKEGITYGYSDSFIGAGTGDEGSFAKGTYTYDRTKNPDYNE